MATCERCGVAYLSEHIHACSVDLDNHPNVTKCPDCGCYLNIANMGLQRFAALQPEPGREQIGRKPRLNKHIAIDKNTLCGAPRIRGTRIPVTCIIQEVDIARVFIAYPQLSKKQIEAALAFAVEAVETFRAPGCSRR